MAEAASGKESSAAKLRAKATKHLGNLGTGFKENEWDYSYSDRKRAGSMDTDLDKLRLELARESVSKANELSEGARLEADNAGIEYDANIQNAGQNQAEATEILASIKKM